MRDEKIKWKYRRRMVFGTAISCLLLFSLALILNRPEAYVAISGLAGSVILGYLGFAQWGQNHEESCREGAARQSGEDPQAGQG